MPLADQGNFQEAANTLSEVADAIEQADLDDDVLQAEHDMLREEAIDMEIGAQRYDAHGRKLSTSASYDTSHLRGADETIAMFGRYRRTRHAFERNGKIPTLLKWKCQTLELTEDILRLGRASDNDIVVPEGSVSKYHCRLLREGENLYLEDLNSTNGTFANRGCVTGRFRLSVGDVMTVGSWLFMFR